jgi:hypothetical protein
MYCNESRRKYLLRSLSLCAAIDIHDRHGKSRRGGSPVTSKSSRRCRKDRLILKVVKREDIRSLVLTAHAVFIITHAGMFSSDAIAISWHTHSLGSEYPSLR